MIICTAQENYDYFYVVENKNDGIKKDIFNNDLKHNEELYIKDTILLENIYHRGSIGKFILDNCCDEEYYIPLIRNFYGGGTL